MTEDHDLTRQDEDMDFRKFDAQEKSSKEPSFGSWPELAGLVLTVALAWLIFAFTE